MNFKKFRIQKKVKKKLKMRNHIILVRKLSIKTLKIPRKESINTRNRIWIVCFTFRLRILNWLFFFWKNFIFLILHCLVLFSILLTVSHWLILDQNYQYGINCMTYYILPLISVLLFPSYYSTLFLFLVDIILFMAIINIVIREPTSSNF